MLFEVGIDIGKHERESFFFIVGRNNEGDVGLGLVLYWQKVILQSTFGFAGIGDWNGFVLTSVKVFLPIFIGLDEPKSNDY